jgi:hypothetical protein
MFSIACLVDFIDISSPIVVSRQYIPEPGTAGLAGASAPAAGRAVAVWVRRRSVRQA